MHEFDKAAGHTAQAKKTALAATTAIDRQKLKSMTLQGETPKVPEQVEIVGYGITTYRKKLCALIDKRSKKAGPIAVKIASAPMKVFMKIQAVAGKVIPTATYGTNWSRPSLKAAAKLRSNTVNCVWGSTSKNRCIKWYLEFSTIQHGLITHLLLLREP